MPTPTKGARFGGSPAHQRLILSNLAQALFENRRITTTEAKARRLRPYAEQLITKAKIDTVANRRQVVKVIRDQEILHTLFTEIGPAMSTRPGGYTRITKIGPRKGDNAPMAVIEIVEAKEFGAQNQTPKKPAKKAAPKAAAVEPEEAPADDEVVADEVVADEAVTEPDVAEASAEVEEAAEPAPEADDAVADDDAAAGDESVTEADVEAAADDVAESVEAESDADDEK
ncbi:50S ribosomal protein L17 [Aeromicrobium sp.]|uniref:50S ribosomal protein L17 n=1 Tax=Aeromicrobium sp. TaxID=1871063 RepID=UPI003C4ECD72